MSQLSKLPFVAVLFATVLVSPGAARDGGAASAEHCVVEVQAQLESGELVMSEPVCFTAFAEAAEFASGGEVVLDRDMSPAGLATSEEAALLATFTIGIHYDGYSGGGSSISVVGSNCNGGYWNTSSTWDDRISSTWNGCYRIKHYQNPSLGGSYRSTYGTGTTNNVPYPLNNDAESISYLSG